MFEKALIEKFETDTELIGLLSTYNGRTAIFSESAPKEVQATDTYITFRIDKIEGQSLPVDRFTINIDVWGYGNSWERVRNIAFKIDLLLDYCVLQSDRYDTIRLYRDNAGSVPEDDPLGLHYNIRFMGRAGRKEWCKQQS